MKRDRLQLLMEIALAVALSSVLHWVFLYQMPQGGTVSLEMLPILVMAFRRGLGVGVVTGTIFGLVDIMFELKGVVHPAQVVLDFPLAMGLVGMAGLFRPVWHRFWEASLSGKGAGSLMLGEIAGIAPGVLLGCSLRFAAHFISGMIFFGSFAPKGQPVWLYSLVYNASYMVPTTIACLVLMWVLAPSLERIVPSTPAAAQPA